MWILVENCFSIILFDSSDLFSDAFQDPCEALVEQGSAPIIKDPAGSKQTSGKVSHAPQDSLDPKAQFPYLNPKIGSDTYW